MRTFEITEGLPEHWTASGRRLWFGLWLARGIYSGPEVDVPGAVVVGRAWSEKRAREQVTYWIADCEATPKAEWLLIDTYGADYDDMREWLVKSGHGAADEDGRYLEDVPDAEIALRVQALYPGGLSAFAARKLPARDAGMSVTASLIAVAALVVAAAVAGVFGVHLAGRLPQGPAFYVLVSAAILVFAFGFVASASPSREERTAAETYATKVLARFAEEQAAAEHSARVEAHVRAAEPVRAEVAS